MAPASSKMKEVGLYILSHPHHFTRLLVLYQIVRYARPRRRCGLPGAPLLRSGPLLLVKETVTCAYVLRSVVLSRRKAAAKGKQAAPPAAAGGRGKSGKVAVDAVFFGRLWKLLKIVMPGVLSPEFWLLVLHSGFLVARTWLSVVVANLDGRLVKNLVRRTTRAGRCVLAERTKRGQRAPCGLGRPLLPRSTVTARASCGASACGSAWPSRRRSPTRWCAPHRPRQCRPLVTRLKLYFLACCPPRLCLRPQIKYLQSRLSLNFRNRLTKHVHKMYLESKTYYKALNLDSRIENADQYAPRNPAAFGLQHRIPADVSRGVPCRAVADPRLITSDVAKFSDALAELYGNICKPALDMYLFSNQLERNLGDRGMGGLWWMYYFTAALMRAVTPNFGKMRETEAKLEVRPRGPCRGRALRRFADCVAALTRTRKALLLQGEFRFAHTRLITNAEEIAFYGGHEIERNILDQRYTNLVRHTNKYARRPSRGKGVPPRRKKN